YVYIKSGRLRCQARKGFAKDFSYTVVVTCMGYLLITYFLANGITEIRNASDGSRCNTELLDRYHFEMMVKDDIFFLRGKLGAISYAHSESDVKDLVEASCRFSESIK